MNRRWMLVSVAVYLAGLALHTADHVRRGVRVIPDPVLVLGYISTVAGLVVVGLVIARHRLAPVFAAIFGFTVAIGVAAVHVPPKWGVLSDPFTGSARIGITGFSWFVVMLEIAGLLGMSAAGLTQLRSRPAL